MCLASDCTASVLGTMYSTVTLDSCVFEYNTADRIEIVFIWEGTLHIMNSTFEHNRADNRYMIFVMGAVVHITNSTFQQNTAVNNNIMTLNVVNGTVSDTVFKHNTGGALSIVIGGSVQITNSTFEYNTDADGCGGAVNIASSVVHIANSTFSDNEARQGGAVCFQDQSEIALDTIIMKNNRAAGSGGAVYLERSKLSNYGNITITNNDAVQGGGIISLQSAIKLMNGHMKILSNTAQQNGGGAYLSASSFYIKERQLVTLTIDSNNAQNYGGGLYLNDKSQLLTDNGEISHIQSNNTALRGGAVYVSDSGSGPAQCSKFSNELTGIIFKQCFIRYFYQISVDSLWANFTNNSAVESGSDIYGGLLDRCIVVSVYNNWRGIHSLLHHTEFSWAPGHHVQNIDQLYNHISSDPVRVCFCLNDVINCSYTHPTILKKKGETFTLTVVAVDQVGMPVNATLISSLPLSENGRLKEGQQLRQVEDQCTEMEYNVYSSKSAALLQVYADGPCGNCVV